ncbi:hypothetical protein GCM10010401_10820 [Rarobacter faecitabidus]|uniref:Cell division protein CrgA n=1 Tax=Rarobacter faecitabidus TaxID=13243 RepID=A0A542ZP89_RARFA|nr:cell division protein CrgA [Rarobacter faecitabidus]TQL62175.1 uncharacterized protein UPF0233 [Rarobacter faecitabidus]
MPTSKISDDINEPDDDVTASGDVVSPADSAAKSADSAKKPELTKARQRAAAAKNRKVKAKSVRPSSANPVWLVPTMLTLLILGLVWIVVFYVTSGLLTFNLPIPGIGQWNLAVGFALILGGGILSTRYQ